MQLLFFLSIIIGMVTFFFEDWVHTLILFVLSIILMLIAVSKTGQLENLFYMQYCKQAYYNNNQEDKQKKQDDNPYRME